MTPNPKAGQGRPANESWFALTAGMGHLMELLLSPLRAQQELSPTWKQMERQKVLDFAHLETRKHFY